jgi:hypothetical protein
MSHVTVAKDALVLICQKLTYKFNVCWATKETPLKTTNCDLKSQFVLLFYFILLNKYMNLKYQHYCIVILSYKDLRQKIKQNTEA